MAELYDRYSSIVYAVAMRVLGDTAAAEDVLQEIFMQLWRNPGTFDASRGSLAPWLAVICVSQGQEETANAVMSPPEVMVTRSGGAVN